MIAMIFEYWLDLDTPEILREYQEAAEEVRAHLVGMEGFCGVERFRSCTEPSKYLAVGFFDDEAAVERWRNHPAHRRVQVLGRQRFFVDYRLRMAAVLRDYGFRDRSQAPKDSRAADKGRLPAGG